MAESCESTTLLYNEADFDGDFVKDSVDQCPRLGAVTANGCPVRDRVLKLTAKHGPRRVVGRLYAAGFPELHAGQIVNIWKVRPGPDRKVATRTTGSLGKFKVRVKKGRYYATSPGLIVPSAGQALPDRSRTVRAR